MKKTIKDTLQAEWFLIRLMFKVDAKNGGLYWLMVSVQQAIPLLSVLIWKSILDQLTVIFQTKSGSRTVWIYLGLYLSLQILSSVLIQVSSTLYHKIQRRASYSIDMAIMEKAAQMDSAFWDRPENRDLLSAAQSSEIHIAGNMPWAIGTAVRIVVFAFGLGIFLSYDPIIGLIYIATYIPGAIVSYKNKAKIDQWSIDNIPETRKKDYYKSLLTGSFAAKDLRLYNLAGYFKEKYNSLWNKIRNERAKLFVKGSVASFLASILSYSGIIAIFLLSVHSVLAGDIAIGTLALYLGLAETSGENFKQIVDDVACQIEINIPYVLRYMDFLKYENTVTDDGTERVPSQPEIEFRNVSFKYPGNQDYTLNNLSFKIGSGQKIALIGVNGAGKTTIVRLLLRLYEPQSGEILLNGRNIRSYPLEELHKIFGVCFQDFNRYSLTLRENIAISDIERKSDSAAIMAASKASGADQIIEELPDGLETDMTRLFNDKGAELSGGQWQKIALARAFFRNSRFIILDEPSAALDPQTEDSVFSSFKRLCQDKGGILISHRLSSIMMVDEIVVIDKGEVIESGTHESLMQKNGKYAKMYRMQAEKYLGETDHE